jgi:hypothetical protein
MMAEILIEKLLLEDVVRPESLKLRDLRNI